MFGINDSRVRERLLWESELHLDTAVEICQVNKRAQLHIKTFSSTPASTAMEVESAAVAFVHKDTRGRYEQRIYKQCDCNRCGTRQVNVLSLGKVQGDH